MKISKIIVAALTLVSSEALACTNLIVGKAASTDGSVIVSYNADSYGMYGFLRHYKAGKHPKGTLRPVYEWDTNRYLCDIPEAPETYNVMGNMNEHQVCITETTFGGREELADSTGKMDYGSMIYIALQRSKTARQAIDVMTGLVKDYGYCSEGETFTIADKNEVWVMEMIGKGPNNKGAVWVAVRIPDDCICAHANQSRIQQFPLNDKKNCIYSKDVISFARQKGYFSGKDKDFSFAKAYAPADFSALRYCEARVWSFFRKYDKTFDKYLDYIKGDASKEPMPLYIKISKKLSVKDIEAGMRDHYEGTPLDLTVDMSAGGWDSPYRPSPLSYKVDDVTLFNERPISTQQTGFTLVAQMRSSLPDVIGGVLWFGCDDANMVAYVPVYTSATEVPECFDEKTADAVTFSWKSSFWVCNWVANMVYPRYSQMFGSLEKVRNELEDAYFANQERIEKRAMAYYEQSPEEAAKFLTRYTIETAQGMHSRWRELGEWLIVKYNDMVIHPDKDGKFLRSQYGLGATPVRPGYSDNFKRHIKNHTNGRYEMPAKK